MLKNEELQKIYDDCGTVIEPDNMSVTMQEIEFLCMEIVKACAHEASFASKDAEMLISKKFGL